jgi:hypothetical protein
MERFSAEFPKIPLADTLFLGAEVNKENEKLLAIEDLLDLIGEEMLAEYNSYYDSAGTNFYPFFRFELDKDLEAYYIGQSDSWVLHNSLFIYSKSQDKFIKNCLASSIDGGDGGQQLLDSWVLDWDGDGKKDLLTRIHDQWIRMDPESEEVIQHVSDSSFVDLNFAGDNELKGLDKLPAFMGRYPVSW